MEYSFSCKFSETNRTLCSHKISFVWQKRLKRIDQFHFFRFIAAFLTILELGGLIYNAIILAENNKSFVLTIGDDMPHYNAYMAGIICGYIVIIAANLILIYGSMKNNRSFLKMKTIISFRWLFVPWLFINMILVIACGVGALTLFVWFSFVQPVSLLLFNLFSQRSCDTFDKS